MLIYWLSYGQDCFLSVLIIEKLTYADLLVCKKTDY